MTLFRNIQNHWVVKHEGAYVHTGTPDVAQAITYAVQTIPKRRRPIPPLHAGRKTKQNKLAS